MRPVPIREIARAINPKGRLIAMLSAFFDASFTEASGVTCVAGYVAPVDEWERVMVGWRDALDLHRLDEYHHATLKWERGAHWSGLAEKSFTSVITSSQLDAIGAALIDSHFHAAQWDEEDRRLLPTPYHYALNSTLNALGEHVAAEHPGEPVAVFCDRDRQPEVIMPIFLRQQEAHPQLESITVTDRRKRPELQCADLAVGVLRESWLRIAKGLSPDEAWGEMPVGRKRRTTFWSLRQGYFIARAWRIDQRAEQSSQEPR